MKFRLRLRTFDKVVLFVLGIFLLVRAPFVFFPLAFVVYMFYTIARNIKERAEKKKRKALRKRAKRMEAKLKGCSECNNDTPPPASA